MDNNVKDIYFMHSFLLLNIKYIEKNVYSTSKEYNRKLLFLIICKIINYNLSLLNKLIWTNKQYLIRIPDCRIKPFLLIPFVHSKF